MGTVRGIVLVATLLVVAAAPVFTAAATGGSMLDALGITCRARVGSSNCCNAAR